MPAIGAARFWMDDTPPVEPLRFRRVPLLAAAVCFAAGDILALRWHGPLLLVCATGALLALAIVSLRKAPRVALVPTLALLIATGCWCAQLQPPVPTQQALTHYADGLSRTVRGRVVRLRSLPASAPNTTAPQSSQSPEAPWLMEPDAWEIDDSNAVQSIDLNVLAIEDVTPDVSTMQPVSGGVRITVQGAALPLACGDIVELPVRLRTPEVYRDPGAWSYSDYLLSEGIGASASAKSARIQTIAHATSGWRCRLFAAQTWASNRLQAFVDSRANHTLPAFARLRSEDAAMLNAMLFGDRTHLSQSLRAGFERTGTFHLFVVSGLHVVLLAGGLFWILRRLRLPEGPAVLLTIAAATGYALLTGFGLPVQRALGMTALYLLARWLGRDVSALNALGAAALAVLAFDPRALFEPSFQMTFLVILAITGLAAPISERTFRPWSLALHHLEVQRIDAHLPPHLAQFRVRVRMADTLAADLLGHYARNVPTWFLRAAFRLLDILLFGLVAEVCMVIPMALYFHRATLLALPLNVVDIPLVAALLCAAVAMFCAALISSWLALVPAAATALLLHAMRFTVNHAQRNPVADLRIPAPAPFAIAAACLAIGFCLWALRARRRLWFRVGLAATLLVPLAILWPAPPLLHPHTLEVTALDVGQGDSLLVVSPTGHTLLVDAGGPTGRAALTSPTGTLFDAGSRWDVGEEVVAPYLWSRRIRRLDAVLLTHAHSDHMGGMPAILRDFRPREFWLSIEPGNSPGLHALLAEAQSLHIAIRRFHAGDAFAWNGLDAQVLAPEATYSNPGLAVNNDSLVVRLRFDRASVLLEGDAEAPSEAAMLDHNRVAPSTLLKVGHHGSRTSTNPAFLAAVSPQDAVISVGAHNTFGHPRAEVLARLEEARVRTFRTDRHGAEAFLLTSDGRIASLPAAPE